MYYLDRTSMRLPLRLLLSPCLGGPVDKSFKFAKDIEAGKLDVYGQLDPNYVQQSAPHMRKIPETERWA